MASDAVVEPEISLGNVVLDNPEMTGAMRLLAELTGGPQLAVLDTSCVRTGLHGQLVHATPPSIGPGGARGHDQAVHGIRDAGRDRRTSRSFR
ncbi:MAG: hypothetical protein JWO62_3323 [Acidimicrobiaceae bacterium]|nr:hypothetical protein [Acidimicrobiaceae bacterium]